MHFLNPGYLWALLALGIPLIVHLFNLQRSEKVIFANTRMLESLVRQTSKARNLRHLLLLFLRMLAMSLLIFAFARPVISETATGSESGLSSVITFADNSASMVIREGASSALDRAIAFCTSIPGRFGEKGWFRLNDNAASSGRTWTSASGFRDQAMGIQKAPSAKNLRTVLQQSYQQFSRKAADGQKHLYILSDFQTGFITDEAAVDFDSSVTHHFVRFGHGEVANIWIDSAWINPGSDEANPRTSISFRIQSSGLKLNKPCRVKLFEGSSLQGGISTEAGSGMPVIASLSLNPSNKNRRLLRLEVEDAAFPSDNAFYILLRGREKLRVLCLSQKENPVFRKLFSSSSLVTAQYSSFQNPDYAALDESDLLILDKPASLSAAIREKINQQLMAGKGVCLIPDDDNVYDLLKDNFLAGPGLQLLAGSKPERESVALPEPSNSFFQAAIRDPGRNPVLPESENRIDISGNGIPLLFFESGKPFLSRIQSGPGSFYLFAGDPADTRFSFHRHPLMLASFFRMARLSKKENATKLFESRNQDRIYLRVDSLKVMNEGSLELRNGRKTVLAGAGSSGKDNFANADFSQLEEGFWEVFQGGELIDAFAVNRPSEESRTEFLSSDELRERLPKKKWLRLEEISAEAGTEHLKAGIKPETELWKLCLILAAVLLVVESLLLRKMRGAKTSAI